MPVPNKLTLDQLNDLLQRTTHSGKEPVSAQEFKPIAERLIEKLEEVYAELNEYVPDNVMHSRWQWVDRSKTTLRTSIRTLQKSIKT